MYRNALDPYGLSYEPNLGWDSPEVTSTANALFAAQPSRFPRWELNALAGGEQAKAGLFGKALGALGLDADGNRAATSWTDAAKHTASNVINAPQDIANQLLSLNEYQPVYGTAGNPDDRALAGRQAGEVFGLAGLAPIAGAGLTRAAGAKGAIAHANSKEASLPGLLMDQESRLARAREMGFDADTTWYHGTNQPLDEIKPDMRDPGAWFTTDISNAANYARGGEAQLYSTRLMVKNPMIVENIGDQTFVPAVGGKPINIDDNVGIVRYGFARGHDAVHFPDGNFSESGNTMVVRHGNQIRDVDAAFDPSQSHSANLLASNSDRASLPGITAQSDPRIAELINRYGWAAAAPLIAAYQSDGAQANALAGR